MAASVAELEYGRVLVAIVEAFDGVIPAGLEVDVPAFARAGGKAVGGAGLAELELGGGGRVREQAARGGDQDGFHVSPLLRGRRDEHRHTCNGAAAQSSSKTAIWSIRTGSRYLYGY